MEKELHVERSLRVGQLDVEFNNLRSRMRYEIHFRSLS